MNESILREKAALVQAHYAACGELRRAFIVKRILSLALTFLWYAVWLYSALVYFSRSYATFNPKNVMMYLSCAALILLPFSLFKPHKALSDRTFSGVVADVRVRGRSGLSSLNRPATLKLIIRPFGRQKSKTVSVVLHDGIKETYPTGCAVCKLAGLAYPVRLDLPPEEQSRDAALCHRCGHFNPRRYTRCFECHAPLFEK